MNHTPAPWTAKELFDDDESLGIAIVEGRHEVAHISSIGEQDFDNAALIAAAPDLLEACIEALNLFDNYPDCYEAIGTLELLQAAIAKATRKSK